MPRGVGSVRTADRARGNEATNTTATTSLPTWRELGSGLRSTGAATASSSRNTSQHTRASIAVRPTRSCWNSITASSARNATTCRDSSTRARSVLFELRSPSAMSGAATATGSARRSNSAGTDSARRTLRISSDAVLYACSACGQDKTAREFSFTDEARRLLNSYCRVCQAAYRHAHYVANKPDYIRRAVAQVHARRVENRVEVLAYLKSHPCVDCGITDAV